MVTEIPDYPTPPLEQVDEQCAAELDRPEKRLQLPDPPQQILWSNTSAAPTNPRTPEKTNPTPAAGTAPTKASLPPANVGTAAPGCPSGPELPGRSAAPPTPAQALSHSPPAATGRERSSEGAQECSPRRKPWVGQPRMNKPRRAYPERSRRGRKKMVRTPRHRRAQPKSAGILRCARRLASVTDVLRSG
jgi:hypothetical protein